MRPFFRLVHCAIDEFLVFLQPAHNAGDELFPRDHVPVLALTGAVISRQFFSHVMPISRYHTLVFICMKVASREPRGAEVGAKVPLPAKKHHIG